MLTHNFIKQTIEFLRSNNQLTQRDIDKLKIIQDELPPEQPVFKEPAKYIHPKRAYRDLVRELTELQPLHNLPNIEKRGFFTYHIDHIISIHYGFHNGIPAEQIAHISNLRVITREENYKKGTKCGIK